MIPTPGSGEADVRISIVASEAEHEECCALRYRVYVEEQGRPSARADHERKLDLSADDATGTIFCARVAGALAGTVRVHHGAVTDIPPFIRRMCGLPQEGALPHVAAIGRLAVDARYRGGTAIVALLRECMAWLNADGRSTQQLFIVALDIPGVIRMYQMLGFKLLEPVTRHISEIGPVVPMARALGGASGGLE